MFRERAFRYGCGVALRDRYHLPTKLLQLSHFWARCRSLAKRRGLARIAFRGKVRVLELGKSRNRAASAGGFWRVCSNAFLALASSNDVSGPASGLDTQAPASVSAKRIVLQGMRQVDNPDRTTSDILKRFDGILPDEVRRPKSRAGKKAWLEQRYLIAL
jgi:hypothetical protein